MILLAGTTGVDVWLADRVYDESALQWPLAHSGWPRAVAYEGAKYILILGALALTAGVLRPSWLSRIGLRRAEAVFVLVCLVVVPLMVSGLKYSSGVACAAELARYGGAYPDGAGHFSLEALSGRYAARGCWPSGHASGGYALLALGLLDRPAAVRYVLWGAGATLGTLMGVYQIARGAHFVSHVAVTALLAQLLVCAIALGMGRWLYRPRVVMP